MPSGSRDQNTRRLPALARMATPCSLAAYDGTWAVRGLKTRLSPRVSPLRAAVNTDGAPTAAASMTCAA
eukprot:3752358-Prymnesium_polylepis.1